MTPKKLRISSSHARKSDRDLDLSDDPHDQASASSDHHDDFTPKSGRTTTVRGRGRGKTRGRPRSRGAPSGLGRPSLDPSTRKSSKPRKNRPSNPPINTSNRKLPQLRQNGNQTDQDDLAIDSHLPRGEYEISQDNDLFNAVRMGTSAIQPTLEDWMEVYQGSSGSNEEDTRGQAISQFINFILRSCGCNCSIDKFQALDLDAVTDTLDDIQETFRTVPSQAYPLSVKSGKSVPKHFRKNLIHLAHQLILLAHSNLVLYDDHFINSLQSYLVSMASSPFRSFRHTSTVISLFGFISPMSELLVNAKKELTSLSRKVQSESAKTHQSKNSQPQRDQLIEWQKRKKQVLDQKTSLEGFISDFFDGVFVHRYRDADPNIRADCVQALGQWMMTAPDYFLESNYLRYIGWVLTDSHKDARNEALKALSVLYSKEENIGVMQHFTSRFRSRLIEMATGETDFTTRCLAIHIVTQIDRHGLLESNQRNQLGRLIYHEDSKVRKAASVFFGNLFEEALDAQKMRLDAAARLTEGNSLGHKTRADEYEKQIAFKCLARLLLKLERQVKQGTDQGDPNDVQSNNSEDDEPELRSDTEGDLEAVGATTGIGGSYYYTDSEKGRMDFAVEDLWSRVEILHEWQALCRYLLLDHTASTNRSCSSSRPVKTGRHNASRSGNDGRLSTEDESHEELIPNRTSVDSACKLNESEETILVEVLVASVRKFSSSLTDSEVSKRIKKKKKRLQPGVTDDEAESNEDEADDVRRGEESSEEELTNKVELTRVMIELLPKLWSKFMTDPVRLAEVFRIPKLMSLNMYLDLRMVSAFEEFWDTMIKHYLKQHHLGVIQMISSTIAHVLAGAKSLNHVNQVKILKLHEALVSSLQDLTSDQSDLENEEMEENEVVSLTLLLQKITLLFRQSDLSSTLKSAGLENQGPSPLDLINSIAHRGRLACANESKLIEIALEILQLNFAWTSASIYRSSIVDSPLSASNPATARESTSVLSGKLEYGLKVRDSLIRLLLEYSFSSDVIVNESVKQSAFIHLLNTYLLCQGALIPEDFRLGCDEEVQTKCATFVEVQIRKFIVENNVDEVEKHLDEVDGDGDRDDVDLEENPRTKKGRKNQKVATQKSKSAFVGYPIKSKAPSVKELRRMEEFDLLITTFAKSIRCGLIHFQHSTVVVQHFSRLTRIFDISAELLTATLNDSISNHPTQLDLVVKCLSDVFKASFELHLVESAYTEEQFLRVCRLLQLVVVQRGPRMSFKSRLDLHSSVKLHLDCIQWLIGRATDPEPEPPLMNKLGAMFKGLSLLLLGTDGQSCLKIKFELERLVEQHELCIPASKSWDPYQNYLKRLITTMAKDPNIKRAARLALQRQGQSGFETSARAEDVVNGAPSATGEEDIDPRNEDLASKIRPKSKARGRKSNTKAREVDVSRPAKSARPSSGSPVSFHTTTSVPAANRRASSVVSVLIPSGPKRKRIGSEQKSKRGEASEARTTSYVAPSGKRARLDAVVIGKNRSDGEKIAKKVKPSMLRRKGRSPESSDSLTVSSPATGTNRKKKGVIQGEDVRRAGSEEDEDSSDASVSVDHESAESEVSLAEIKRKSRQKV